MLSKGFEDELKAAFIGALIGLAVLTPILGVFHTNLTAYGSLTKEDGLVENLTAIFYFVSGAWILYWRFGNSRSKDVSFLWVLLAIFFLFVAGEEISWGQRIFSIESPEVFIESNTQGEMNLHNLSVFDKATALISQHTVLNLFALAFGVVIPLLNSVSTRFRNFGEKIGLPIVPFNMATLLLVALFFGYFYPRIFPHWGHTEVKEMMLSLGFFGLVISKSYSFEPART